MTTFNNDLVDQFDRTIRPVLFNTKADGSGTWYFALLDSDGHLQVDVLANCNIEAVYHPFVI